MKSVQEKETGYPGFTNPKFIASADDRRLTVRHLKTRLEALKVKLCPLTAASASVFMPVAAPASLLQQKVDGCWDSEAMCHLFGQVQRPCEAHGGVHVQRHPVCRKLLTGVWHSGFARAAAVYLNLVAFCRTRSGCWKGRRLGWRSARQRASASSGDGRPSCCQTLTTERLLTTFWHTAFYPDVS